MKGFLWKILVVLLIVRPLSGTINPGDRVLCTPVPGKQKWCACKSSTSNMIVDLSPLEIAGHRKPSYTAMGTQVQSKGWTIAWSPCNNFDIFADESLRPEVDRACNNTGFAYYTNGSVKFCFSFGSHGTSPKLRPSAVDLNSRIILYQRFTHKSVTKNGPYEIQASVRLVCGNSTALTFHVSNEDYGTHISAQFTSNCCCEGTCADKRTSKDPHAGNKWWIIGGSISSVVLLVVIIVVARRKGCNPRPRPPPPPPPPPPAPQLHFPVRVEFNPEEQEERRQEQIPLIA